MHTLGAFVAFAALLVLVQAMERGSRCSTGKLDLVLVVDVSGSVENRFITNRDAALEVARTMPIGWDKTVVAVIQFSKLAIMKLEFGTSVTWEIVNDTIVNLEWTGDVSQTAEAMDLAMIQFRRSRSDAQRAIVLFSDGNSFNTWQQVTETAERLKYSKAKIFAVSLAGNTYETELKQYVEPSNGTIVRRQSEFQQLKRDLFDMTQPGGRCQAPAPAPPPALASPPQDSLRAAEGNPDQSDNQLPTRRPTHRNTVPRPARVTTRSPQANHPPVPVASGASLSSALVVDPPANMRFARMHRDK